MATRTIKIILWAVLLSASAAVFTFVRDPRLQFTALVAGAISLYLLSLATYGRHTGYFEEINSDLEIAREAIENLIQAAKRSIRILSGTLSPEIYFFPPVFKALQAAVERGVQVEVLLGEPDAGWHLWRATVDENALTLFSQWVGTGRVRLMKAFRRIAPHFIVVDSDHVRIEERHRPRKPGDPLQKRRATIQYFETRLTRRYDGYFTRCAGEASELTLPAAN